MKYRMTLVNKSGTILQVVEVNGFTEAFSEMRNLAGMASVTEKVTFECVGWAD